jgi:glycosyltransferase involved in cell wall biosynthesis
MLMWKFGMRLFYKHADKIVAVSQGVAEDLRTITGLPGSMFPVVPNPVITQRIFTLAKEPQPHHWFEEPEIKIIIGIGRLTHQKDFQTLIKAFGSVKKTRDCRLIILGEGRQRDQLDALAVSLGIEKSLHMPGFVTNPYSWLSRCSLFVLSSRWEGSPNVLKEALALGIPVVSTDCPSGPREILCDGRFGTLVPVGDHKTMAEAILQTLEAPLPRQTLKEAVTDFTVERSVQGYLEVFGLVKIPGSASGDPS